MRNFYTREPEFASRDSQGWSDQCDPPRRLWLMLTLLFWLPFTCFSVYVILNCSVTLAYAALTTAGLVSAGLFLGGLDSIQAGL